MRPALRALVALPVIVSALALFILMSLTFADVILRSAFNAPIEAATELTRILVAVTVFAVLPHVSVQGQHIAVDLLDPIFERLRLTRLRDGIIYIVSGAMLYWPIAWVWKLAERAGRYGDLTEYLSIPVQYVGYFIAISTGIAAVAMVFVGGLTLFAPRVMHRSAL